MESPYLHCPSDRGLILTERLPRGGLKWRTTMMVPIGSKMMVPSGSVGHKVTVDVTRLVEEVSPGKMSIQHLYMYTYREIHYCHSSLTPLWLHRSFSELTLFFQEVSVLQRTRMLQPHSNGGEPAGLVETTRTTFSDTLPVHVSFLDYLHCFLPCWTFVLSRRRSSWNWPRRSSLSPDTMTLLVFLNESLTLVRKIRSSRIVHTTLED